MRVGALEQFVRCERRIGEQQEVARAIRRPDFARVANRLS
jgi:hypothetical protein